MNREISLHTIALYNGTEYELGNLLNILLYKIDQLEQELQRKDNETKQLREDIVNHIKIASEYKEQMIIKDNNWNELKKYINKMIEKDKKYTDIASRYGVLNCKSILVKIKKLEGKK